MHPVKPSNDGKHVLHEPHVLPSAEEFGVTRKEIIAEPSRPKVLKDMERAFSQALSTAAIFASHKDHPPRLVR